MKRAAEAVTSRRKIKYERPPHPLQRRGRKDMIIEDYELNRRTKSIAVSQKTTSPTPPKEGLEKQKPGYVTANPLSYNIIKQIRDELKKNPTEAEIIIWEYLKNKNTGYKIRRQHIIDNFIADFVCLPKKLVIEIDGKIHQFQKEYDQMRTERFKELDFTVIRFTNEEVKKYPYEIFLQIKQILENIVDPNSPPLEGLGEVI